MAKQRLLNHVKFVIDRSGSMGPLNDQVDQVVRNQITRLNALDEQTGQETHVSIYVFGSNTRCIIYDTDVKRLVGTNPLAGQFDGGMTSLIDAVLTVREESALIAQLHCDHAFLDFYLTDGGENDSHNTPRGRALGRSIATYANANQIQAKLVSELKLRLASEPENVTVAVMVPDILCKRQAINFGFAPDNIMIWDVSAEGLAVAEQEVAQRTEDFYTARASGVRGTKSLFSSVVVRSVKQEDVDKANLKPIDPNEFMIIPVALSSSSKLEIKIPAKSKTKKNPDGIKHVEIQPFIEETGRPYVAGTVYYRLTKSEKYSFGKGVALVHRTTRKVYRGPECEKLIELDANTTRIKPPLSTDEYEVYVKSTSLNRQIEVGGSVLVFNK